MKDLKEFQSSYSYDDLDLLSLGVGSGIHLNKDVLFSFQLTDRQGQILQKNDQVVANKYVKSVVFDIADTNDNIVYANYQSGLSTSLSIGEKDNQLIFGDYQKDFCINFRVEDNTTDIVSSGKYYVYGNDMQVKSIKAYDSVGEKTFNERIGPYMIADFGSGDKLFSGKMELKEQEDEGLPEIFFISGVKNHPEMPSGLQDHYWEASLTWDFNGSEIEPNPSHPFLSGVKNFGGWTFLFNDLSPSGYFLISEIEGEKSYPYGLYSDGSSSGLIKQYGQEPSIVTSGVKNEDSIALEIQYENLQEFTKNEGLEVYSYTGDQLDEGKFDYFKTLDGPHSEKINIQESDGLIVNTNTWYRVIPKGSFGLGESWTVGPFIKNQQEESDNVVDVGQIDLRGSEDSSANVNFKKGSILNLIDGGSGVVDRLFVNKEDGKEISIYESNSGLSFDYNTIPANESGIWSKSYFEYSLMMYSNQDPYKLITRDIKIMATGTSLSGSNEGLPLFKFEGLEDLEGESLDLTAKYSESGVTLLANTGQEYTTYKFYKTSF